MGFAESGERLSASEQAYRALRERILDMSFAPGAPLFEGAIGRDFGFSRTPVREALKRLAREGLVTVRPQQGSFVAPIKLRAVANAQFARKALECALIREAARCATDKNLRHLEFNLDCQRHAVTAADYDELYRLDEQMHADIAAAALRPELWEMISDIKMHMDRVRRLTLEDSHAPSIVEQHREIIAALAAGDGDRAAAAMGSHLDFVIEHFEEFVPTQDQRDG